MKHVCPDCEGRGWYIGSAMSASHEQVPVQVQCERCYGKGEIDDESK